MSPKDSELKQWSDPKDFGLPFVEITPLRPKLDGAAEEQTLAVAELESDREASVAHVDSSAVVKESAPAAAPLITASKPSVAPAVSPVQEEKSKSWIWAVLLIGLGIVAVIVWQILASRGDASNESAIEVVEEPEENTSVLPAETTAADQNQSLVNQDSIASLTISDPNISQAGQSGTTIANTAPGNLIRVEQKGERPEYFIIVGSLPNEALALEQSQEYFGKSPEVYLIAPFDGGKNYRLALARFTSFKEAAAKLEEIKSQYTEELWILKY